jgi:hypothetical protein
VVDRPVVVVAGAGQTVAVALAVVWQVGAGGAEVLGGTSSGRVLERLTTGGSGFA